MLVSRKQVVIPKTYKDTYIVHLQGGPKNNRYKWSDMVPAPISRVK